ncbi:hypothetical protein [Rhodococcus sp. WAY2]|uniref:hypothetical protein n=1 Tax=Rhodococcus sp. WAY2 TaxID=2663121 RepID=UPI00131FA09B|nr:hypothetical protein [Rhodococcus sp. WAY2]QHE73500.1 hypothetical protein GFS60_07160 [Rhodococcus sp. WAY2]
MTATTRSNDPAEVHWDTVVLNQAERRRSRMVDSAGATLVPLIAVGTISAGITALSLLLGGAGTALLHVNWEVADPARAEEVVDDFLNVVPEAGTALLGTLLVTGAAIAGLHLLARIDRRRQPARIVGAEFEHTPEELRQLMSDAVLAVEQIKHSRAFHEGMFTDLDLRTAMWDLGARVLAAAELHEAITAAASARPEMLTPDDHQAYLQARIQIEHAVQALRDAADTVAELSSELTAADAASRAAVESSRQIEASSGHLDRLAHAHTAVAATTATPAITVTDLSETISTRVLAYRDLPRP